MQLAGSRIPVTPAIAAPATTALLRGKDPGCDRRADGPPDIRAGGTLRRVAGLRVPGHRALRHLGRTMT